VAFAFAAAVQIFNTFFALAKSAKQKNPKKETKTKKTINRKQRRWQRRMPVKL